MSVSPASGLRLPGAARPCVASGACHPPASGTLEVVSARVEPWKGGEPSPEELEDRIRGEGLRPHEWGNSPGDTYAWHRHDYAKVLYCVEGSITFHLREEDDVALSPGDRLEIEAGTDHAATVGPDGVRCLEAPR